MKPEIIFIIEEFDTNGMFQTIEDKYKSICQSKPDNWYYINKNLWADVVGNKIKFQTYSSITTFDPSVKYFYFCPLFVQRLDWFKFRTMLSDDKYRNLIENNVILIFNDDCEALPWIKYDFFNYLLEWLWDCSGYVAARICFMSMAKLLPSHNNFISHYFHNKFKFLYSPLALKRMNNELEEYNFNEIFDSYLNSVKQKQFINLNLNPRFNRQLLLHSLRAHKLMEEGYVSYGRKDFRRLTIDNLKCSNTNYFNLIKKDMETELDLMFVDEIDPEEPIKTSLTIPKNLMDKSCYDIVSETVPPYEIDGTFDQTVITEKIIKSLYFGRPFLVNGGPYVLETLRELGFKTCDWLFDESYDQMENVLDRQEAIISNIKRYSGQTDKIMEIVKQNRDVLEYNHNHLVNFNFEDYFVNMLKSL